MNTKSVYSEKLKSPLWQKKRLEILNRDGWRCQICGDPDTTLHVHHRTYLPKKEPWDIPNELLVTLCEDCHEGETRDMKNALDAVTEALKAKFFSGDLIDIAFAISNIHHYYASEVTASIIKHWLSDKERFVLLGDAFFEHLSNKNNSTEAVNTTP